MFGAPFTLITDHKPLQLIYNNPQSRHPERIERWFLRLQQYDFQVIYKKGSDNPADFLSAGEAAIPLTVIREHTSKDSNLIAVRKAGDWTDELVKPFFSIKEEIAMDNKNGVVLRGTRIVIPRTLPIQVTKVSQRPKLCYANTPGFPIWTRQQNRKSRHVYRAKSMDPYRGKIYNYATIIYTV